DTDTAAQKQSREILRRSLMENEAMTAKKAKSSARSKKPEMKETPAVPAETHDHSAHQHPVTPAEQAKTAPVKTAPRTAPSTMAPAPAPVPARTSVVPVPMTAAPSRTEPAPAQAAPAAKPPGSMTKQERLAELLEIYKADKITPA